MFSRVALKGTLLSLIFHVSSLSSLWAQGSEYHFPQVADGFTMNIFYSTSFLLNNASNTTTSVTMRFFRQNGTGWPIDLRSVDRSELAGRRASLTFNLQPRETVEFFTGGIDTLGVGWAKVESDIPIEVSEVFQVFSNNPVFVKSEAGVLPSPAATQFSFYATVSANEPVIATHIDTGFAIANPSGMSAQITATLFNRSGVQLTQRSINLSANEHTSQFVSQLFSNVSLPSLFHGLVRFSSNVNIAVVGLRQTYGNSDTISTIAINPDSTLGYITIYDREPNDSRATAQPVGSLPAEIIGTMNSPSDGGDLDFFSLSLRAGDVLHVFVVADLINSPLDDLLVIRDSTGASVATNDDFSTGLRDPFIRFQVPANGTYFLDHGSKLGTSSRNSHYRLLVRVK